VDKVTLTDDTLFDGRLICRQHRDGYRFSVDAVLAASFCTPPPQGKVLDLGCGCGVISLILCHRYPELQVTGIELQPRLAELSRSNSSANEFQNRFMIQEGDLGRIREFMQPESFDCVVTNPPYRRPGSGRINREDECAIARHELKTDLESVIAAASFCVKNRGLAVCIYPADRLASLIHTMQKHRLTAKRILPVYSYPEDNRARLVVVEAAKNGGEGVCLLPPLYIYQYPDGPYSQEMERFYHDKT
jgi:tRNA1Val (adenine37-N6)-methyltransferase